MAVGADCSYGRPAVVQLVGKEKRGGGPCLIDPLVGWRGRAPEKNFVAGRTRNLGPAYHPLLSALRLIESRQGSRGCGGIGQRSDYRCVEPGDIRDIAKIHVCEVVRREVLALVVLESFREPQTWISETDVRAVVTAARDAIETEHWKNSKSG